MIVSERFVKHYFPDRDPLGQEIKGGRSPKAEIIGVVGDVTDTSFRETPREILYFPLKLTSYPPIIVRAKPGVDPKVCEAELIAAFTALAPNIPFDSGTLTEAVQASLRRDRLIAQLSVAFGLLGVVLAAIGLYGSTAYVVRSRTREIGLRMALGAQRGDVVRLMMRDSVWVTIGGIAFGLVLAIAAGRLIESLLWQVSASDPVMLAVAALILACIGLSASLGPAVRASRLNPSRTLRCD
jgi:hypothetical protein